MRTIIDTRTLPHSSRIAAWESASARAFAPQQAVVISGRDDFPARIEVGRFGPLKLSFVCLEQTRLEWISEGGSVAPREMVAISVGVSGRSTFGRVGHDAFLSPGDVLLIDSRSPYSGTHEDGTKILTVAVPRAMLEDRVGPVASLDGFTLPGNLPSTRIVVHYLQSLVKQTPPSHARGTSTRGVEEITRLAIELLVFALNDALNEDPPNFVPPSTVAILRIEQALTHHLRNPDAGAETIASDAGVSVRYANQLLAKRGTSLMRELNRRRLQRATHDLAQPVNAGRAVSDVARAWGFRHMSRFSSRFREQWGVSPHEFRKVLSLSREDQ